MTGPDRPLYGKPYTGHDYDGPVLPYGNSNPSSGFSGSTTSEASTRAQDADGRTADKQAEAILHLSAHNRQGLTWRELDRSTGWGHGSTSRVLSDLHKAGRIARLTEERLRCKVYVLPEWVGGRETESHGGKKSAALAAAEEKLARLSDMHQPTSASPGAVCREDEHPWPCTTREVLDG